MVISEIKAKEKDETEELYKNLIEDFNKISKELKSKFRLEERNSGFPELVKPFIFSIGNSLGENIIFFDRYNNRFYFYNGVDKELFEWINPILKELKQDFYIELT